MRIDGQLRALGVDAVELPNPPYGPSAEASAEAVREAPRDPLYELVAVARASSARLLDFDDVAADEPVRVDHRHVGAPVDVGARRLDGALRVIQEAALVPVERVGHPCFSGWDERQITPHAWRIQALGPPKSSRC